MFVFRLAIGSSPVWPVFYCCFHSSSCFCISDFVHFSCYSFSLNKKNQLMLSEKEKCRQGLLYDANYDPELIAERMKCKDLCFRAARCCHW